MPEAIRKYYEIQLLWIPHHVVKKDGTIATVFTPPEKIERR